MSSLVDLLITLHQEHCSVLSDEICQCQWWMSPRATNNQGMYDNCDDCSPQKMSDSLPGSKCYQAFNLILALVFLTLGSLLTALVVSHSPAPASNSIVYLGPSLLAVGGLVLALSISLLLLRLSKTQKQREAKLDRKLKRSQATVLRVKCFSFSSPHQPGLDSLKVPEILITRSCSMENNQREKPAWSPFRLRHKVSHDLGASYGFLLPRSPVTSENEATEQKISSPLTMSNSVIPVVSVIML